MLKPHKRLTGLYQGLKIFEGKTGFLFEIFHIFLNQKYLFRLFGTDSSPKHGFSAYLALIGRIDDCAGTATVGGAFFGSFTERHALVLRQPQLLHQFFASAVARPGRRGCRLCEEAVFF